jgi:hypothetical protein
MSNKAKLVESRRWKRLRRHRDNVMKRICNMVVSRPDEYDSEWVQSAQGILLRMRGGNWRVISHD